MYINICKYIYIYRERDIYIYTFVRWLAYQLIRVTPGMHLRRREHRLGTIRAISAETSTSKMPRIRTGKEVKTSTY